jgi:hypothetical protein
MAVFGYFDMTPLVCCCNLGFVGPVLLIARAECKRHPAAARGWVWLAVVVSVVFWLVVYFPLAKQ